MKKGEKSDNNNKQKKRKTSYSDDSDDDYVLEDDDDVESNGSEGFIDHNNPSEDEEVGFDDSEEKEGYVIGSDSDDDDDDFISSRKRKRKQKVIVRSKDSKSGGKRTRVKPQRRKKTSDSNDDDSDGDDDDEDYCVFDDEFAIEKVATGSKSSGKKTRRRSRQSSNRSTWVRKVEEEDCEFEDESVGKTTRGRQLSSRNTRVSNEVEEEEYCESEDALGGKKNRGRIQSSNRDTRVSDEDVEYCEFEDELVAKKTKGRRQSTSKRSKASDDDDEEYDLEDENDEDEEFEPDGIDFVDEEDEDLEEVEYMKAVKRRKISVKGRNRKRKTKVSKKRKRERGILGVTKPAESSDEDFVDTVSVAREKCKKTTRSRTKRVVTEWDSDSASSKSSDLEYTISEEEKESLEEAKKFCGELKTCTRSSVPAKKSQVDVEALDLQEEKPLRRLRKGKATVKDLINDSGKQVCGICLSEEGNAIVKGTLDCCSHYFCFGCIMEWSKVESRCPLCKQRFSSITRAPRSSIGIDLRTTVVQVPMRDQVYRPSEEEVRGYFDPYENVLCMECHQGGDDSLMLLCDICDSPAHTYCVGLQREVPEGNWYCEGCRISEAGSSNIQLQIPVVNRGLSGNVSISTSVSAYRTDTEGLFPPPLHFPIQQPSYSQGYRNLQSPRYHVHATSPSGAGVSTLSGRRRVHRQVHDRFSINRENQMTDYLGRTSAIPEIDLNREVVEAELCEDLIDQRSRDVLISGSISTEFDHWVREGGSHSARLCPSRQVAGLGTSTTVTDGSELATLRSEHDMTNLLLGSEQFNHCSSVRSDDSISPHTKSYIHRESAS
ncbi:probable serine/threonine-protein kinase kinX [Papaver somniferum]|uniref:probable serine/threonine-protein kinase kinX n=1 Tax=Papaver somniferum TaxID=3469 RepID=UPI000E702712|nr:probable serine/threonine-protein kinase kinX [Papaver somniferum]